MTTDDKKNFHSFRHTVINTLKQAEVQDTVIKELVGHTDASLTTGRYGKRYQAALLLEALKKLEYGVDFSGLKGIVDLVRN